MAVLEDECDGKMLHIGQNVSVKHSRCRMLKEKKLSEKLRHPI